jgi:hypothetical protein
MSKGLTETSGVRQKTENNNSQKNDGTINGYADGSRQTDRKTI